MNSYLKLLIPISCLFLLAVTPPEAAYGQSAKKIAHTIKVNPVISFQGTEKDRFQQCLFRELRKIPEVVIVDSSVGAWYVLSVLVVEARIAGGTKIGYNASVVVLAPINGAYVAQIGKANDPAAIEKLLEDSYWFERNLIFGDPSLDSMCQDIVASFDTKSVEKARQILQSLD